MRELESKLIVYTVLAIILGYIFVSTIPSQLAPPLFEAVQPEERALRIESMDDSESHLTKNILVLMIFITGIAGSLLFFYRVLNGLGLIVRTRSQERIKGPAEGVR